MSRDDVKKALRNRITELRQWASECRIKGMNQQAREYDARALECDRTLDLFSR